MSKKNYRMTTAIVATLAMGFPQFTLAQDAVDDSTLLLCMDGTEPPCPEGEPLEGTAVPAQDDEETVGEPVVESEMSDESDLDATAETMTPEAEAEPTVEDEPEGQSEPEAEPAAEPEVEPEAEIAVDPVDAIEPDVEAETLTDTDTAGDDTTVETDTSADANADTQDATDTTVAAAAAGADAEPTEVTEDTIGADEVRTSDEEFETQVDGSVAESGEETADAAGDDENDGLSRFEQALLLGLGAVAVGALLDDGSEVVANTGDRVVVDRDGQLFVYKDDDALLFREGTNVRTETFSDGSTRTFVARTDGGQIVTVRDAEGRVLRRTLVAADGTEVDLFDDTVLAEEIDVTRLSTYAQVQSIPFSTADEEALLAALQAESSVDRRFSLRQIREFSEVRSLLPGIDLDTISFATGSAAIPAGEIEAMSSVGNTMEEMLRANPREVFLIEGHTDAVGDAATNLALSDRRAETVALALTEYFAIPPENLVVQGYGEQFLKVETEVDEQANRRATVRRITPLLQTATAD